jgi:formamidopyrimidine-DNA glycosylase
LRTPIPPGLAKHLTGQRVVALRRRGKFILADLSGGETLVVHLGMSGRMRVTAAKEFRPQRHDHVLFFTDTVTIAFNDPRRFGLITFIPTARLDVCPPLAGLGPEPLSADFTARRLAAALAGKRTPIKMVLLNQPVVAGLGNIYVAEALFRAGISPLRPATEVTDCAPLVAAIKAVLRAAIKAGGSTLRDARFLGAGGETGYFQTRLQVYDREGQPCLRPGCHGSVRRIIQAGRSSFFCPHCQH